MFVWKELSQRYVPKRLKADNFLRGHGLFAAFCHLWIWKQFFFKIEINLATLSFDFSTLHTDGRKTENKKVVFCRLASREPHVSSGSKRLLTNRLFCRKELYIHIILTYTFNYKKKKIQMWFKSVHLWAWLDFTSQSWSLRSRLVAVWSRFVLFWPILYWILQVFTPNKVEASSPFFFFAALQEKQVVGLIPRLLDFTRGFSVSA